jgi:hypothetical protein
MGNTFDGLGVARAGAIFILPITSYSKATLSLFEDFRPLVVGKLRACVTLPSDRERG